MPCACMILTFKLSMNATPTPHNPISSGTILVLIDHYTFYLMVYIDISSRITDAITCQSLTVSSK
jgi:hypothetical protein